MGKLSATSWGWEKNIDSMIKEGEGKGDKNKDE